MRKKIKTTCGICPIGCGIVAEIENGKILKIKGDDNHPLNLGKICPKGACSLEYLYSPLRLKSPLKRIGKRGEGKWKQISWDEALRFVANNLINIRKEFGSESMAFVHGSAKGLQDSYLARFSNLYGSPNISWQGHVCFVPRVIASKMTYGFYPVPDYDGDPKCIVVWGRDTKSTLYHVHFRILRSLDRGAKLIVIDPRSTELAKKADLWLKIKPLSDLALALGLIKVIIEDELYDRNFVEKYTFGFEKLKEWVRSISLDFVEKNTWISKDKIVKLARLYSKIKPVCIEWGNPIDQGIYSFQTARALCILKAITGNIGILGGEIETRIPKMFGRRSPELELWDKVDKNIKNLKVDKDITGLPNINYVAPQAIINAILEERPYPIHGLYIQGANPLLTYPNAKRVYKALLKVKFLVVVDMFMTPTASLADVVLPCASFWEYNSIVSPPYSYPVISVQQKISRIKDVKSDYEILTLLANFMGFGDYFWETEEEALDFILSPSGISFKELKEMAYLKGKKEYLKKEHKFSTPTGKIELYSNQLAQIGLDPLPKYEETSEDNEFPFLLTSYKSFYYRHSGGRQIPTLRSKHPYPCVVIHQKIAEEMDIKDGDWIRIKSKNGMIRQKAVISTDIDPRVIICDYGWWFPEEENKDLFGWKESNINVLTSDTLPFNKEIGSTTLRGIWCKIEKDS